MHAGATRQVLRTLATVLIVGGCAVSPITKSAIASTDQQLLAALADGSAQLATLGIFSGYSEAMKEGAEIKNLRGLYDTRSWRQLAIEVMRIGSGSDLSWFYLGRAAEGLGYFGPAAVYYHNSIESAEKKGISGCVGSVCSGFEFPDAALSRLKVVCATFDENGEFEHEDHDRRPSACD